jgi:hypothetical protein
VDRLKVVGWQEGKIWRRGTGFVQAKMAPFVLRSCLQIVGKYKWVSPEFGLLVQRAKTWGRPVRCSLELMGALEAMYLQQESRVV